MSDMVRRDREGPLEVLTLDDPEHANALSGDMIDALHRALVATAVDDELRAVIVTGAGRHFSAGADLASLEKLAAGGDEAANRADSQRLERMYEALLGHPKLTVAAVHGAAIGGGCGLATACDLVVAEPSAQFAYTEVTIGFIPALVSTFLTRRVPGHVARRLLIDPERVDGRRAVELGLADELVAEGQSLTEAKRAALRISRKASPTALAATKRLLNQTVGRGWREALVVAAGANVAQRQHPDCRRGVRAFLDSKSTPDWLEPEE
jgi:methylglutaconyl-CoA hydratase